MPKEKQLRRKLEYLRIGNCVAGDRVHLTASNISRQRRFFLHNVNFVSQDFNITVELTLALLSYDSKLNRT